MNIHKTAFIHPLATAIGLVEMGPYSSLWPGTVVRADMNQIVLGKGVNIQDNSTLHTDSSRGITIGDYTLVGHNTMLHGCKIGRGCLIGIGSIVLDEAEIGDGAMITAGCMIRGGKKIP
ncbi:gamma carbonic anhydrase family protein, partial [Leptospira interrogans]